MLYKFIPSSITLDQDQTQLSRHLEQIARDFDNQSRLISFWQRLKPGKNSVSGIYLYGGVGCGKTMLMKAFFDRVEATKEFVHYQNFMHMIHTKLHKLQGYSKEKIIRQLADSIADRSKILCVDEFEIKDISDAMIISQLFKYLLSRKVFIFLTTNTAPDMLYKDGIGRESFLPFITMIKQRFAVFCLDSIIDYRFSKLSFSKRILYPINNNSRAEIQRVTEDLCGSAMPIPGKIEVFGREIQLKRTHKKILFTDFYELFEQELGYADYVNICQFFELIFVENIREIKAEEANIITRFINFIDNAYFYKVILFVTLAGPPEDIYPEGSRLGEFKRTISRLNEMNTEEYLISGHQGQGERI